MMKTLSVTELTSHIKSHLEKSFSYVCVQGEISNCKLQSSGHYYFTLKDATSQLSSVIFKGQARNLSRPPKDGDQVILQGEISVYAPRGNYQLIVKTMDYIGVGNLLLKLHELKTKLEQLGYFAADRKKKLPKSPKTIGVITSPTGAVIQDILHVLQRRAKGFHLILNPVKVQGDGASQEIASAIEQCNKHQLCDVLIVARGGGSLEDLWAFNEEILVKAIYDSKIPVISAVGHETDISLCDFAADVRAPTPSAAAEICTAEKTQQLSILRKTSLHLDQLIRTQLISSKKQLQSTQRHPYLTSSHSLLAAKLQDMDEKLYRVESNIRTILNEKTIRLRSKQQQALALMPLNLLKNSKEKLMKHLQAIEISMSGQISKRRALFSAKAASSDIDTRQKNILKREKDRLDSIASHLKTLNPKNLLNKGYCILFSEKKDSVILSKNDVKLKQNLHLLLKDGHLQVTVEDIQ
jgi:exodeoxyribonuclease VII large subunit